MNTEKPQCGDTRRLFSVAIHSGEVVLLRGWGLTPGAAVKDLKLAFFKDCIEMALNCSENKSKTQILKQAEIHFKSGHNYDQFSWSYDYYDQIYDSHREDWNSYGKVGHWNTKYPIKLGL